MAKNESRRISPAVLQSDQDGFDALRAVAGYDPSNPVYTIAAITAAQTELDDAQAAEAQADAAAAAARDNAVAKEWAFHNLMLGAKEQVIAQFGKDSSEVQALGLKRKSEYRSRGRGASRGSTPA